MFMDEKLKQTKIKTIIFDFGGVVGTNADTIFIEVLMKHDITRERATEIWNEHWPKLENGRENVRKIWESVQDHINCDVSKFIQEYENKIQVYPEVIEICKKLKSEGFKLGMLANEALEWMNIKIKKVI